MAENSAIEWTDTTWNPLSGCTRASPGCDHCYAAVMALRLQRMAEADLATERDPGGKRKYMGVATRTPSGRVAFNGTINLDDRDEALNEPFTWTKPRRVFVNSMSDLFHKDVPSSFIRRVFEVMAATPRHTYQVLTKRPERMAEWTARNCPAGVPLNVWVGTSIESDDYVGRADALRQVRRMRGGVRFISAEPLLGPLPSLDLAGIHWLIVGGESGHGARPMHPDWARDLRDRATAAGVKFFFKQWGAWVPYGYIGSLQDEAADRWDGDWTRCAIRNEHGMQFVRVGKKAAGRVLDGRTWDEAPHAAD